MVDPDDAIIFVKRLGESRGVVSTAGREAARGEYFASIRNRKSIEIARYIWIHADVRQPGRWIAGHADRLITGQKPVAKVLVGNDRRHRHSERLPQAFVITKKERLILFNRTDQYGKGKAF